MTKECFSHHRNTINHVCNLLEQHGTDFWWKLHMKELLPENLHSSPPELVEKGEVRI